MHKDGITVWGSAYNIISGNRISRCKRFGIDLPGGDYNTISRNSFDNNNVGIHVSGYHNVIKQNNFINNQKNAFFDMLLPLEFPFDNRWIKNYWDDWVGIGPKIIRGSILYFIPWFDFDWIHAREPYDTIENNN
jgi:parallel beta-helix repeat protein